MKKLLLPLLMALPLTSLATDAPLPQAPRHHLALEQALELTEPQSREIRTIRQQQFEELRALNERADQRIREVLDPQQQARYQELKDRHVKQLSHPKRQDRRSGPSRHHAKAMEPAKAS